MTTSSAAPVVHLGLGRSALFAEAESSGKRVLLVTPPTSRLTLAMHNALEISGGKWRIALSDGTAVDAERATESLPESTVAITRLSIEAVHPPRSELRIGGVIERAAALLGAGACVAWDVVEPAGAPWDRAALTDFARSRLPRATRVIVETESGVNALLSISRGGRGVIEQTVIDTIVSRDAMTAALATLVEELPVTFGSAIERPGAANLLNGPSKNNALEPVGITLGPRAVRDLGLDVARFSEEHGAITAGSSRAPSVVIPISGGWQQYASVVRAFDPAALARALGMSADVSAGSWQGERA